MLRYFWVCFTWIIGKKHTLNLTSFCACVRATCACCNVVCVRVCVWCEWMSTTFCCHLRSGRNKLDKRLQHTWKEGVLPKQAKRQPATCLFTVERTSYTLLNWVLIVTVHRACTECVLNTHVSHQQIKRHRHSGECRKWASRKIK